MFITLEAGKNEKQNAVKSLINVLWDEYKYETNKKHNNSNEKK